MLDANLIKNFKLKLNLFFRNRNKFKSGITLDNVTSFNNGGDGIRIEGGGGNVEMREVKTFGNHGKGINITHLKHK